MEFERKYRIVVEQMAKPNAAKNPPFEKWFLAKALNGDEVVRVGEGRTSDEALSDLRGHLAHLS